MPNTFVDNRDAWLRLSDVDYLGQFVKVWLAFNAWYRSAYAENQDRKIINEIKWNSNPICNAIRPLFDRDSEESVQLRSDIGLLHNRLENYEIRTGKNGEDIRISFQSVFLKERTVGIEAITANRHTYEIERILSGHQVRSTIKNSSGTIKFNLMQTKFDIEELQQNRDFMRLSQPQKSQLMSLYSENGNYKNIANFTINNSDIRPISCGSFSFYCSREELFAGVVEILYLMRCHLFHGELSPTKQATECYEPAYRIIRKFLECIQ